MLPRGSLLVSAGGPLSFFSNSNTNSLCPLHSSEHHFSPLCISAQVSMIRQVISQTLRKTGKDFPRLNGSNFAMWNARVRTALDSQGLLGFIDQENFDGDSSSSPADSDEDLTPLKPQI